MPIQVIDKRDGKAKAILPDNDETIQVIKASGHYRFKQIKNKNKVKEKGENEDE